jgi:large subunit ribosomal protein L21
MAVKKATTKKVSTDEFAVIFTGGKQYRVSVGEKIDIEIMKGEFKEGDKVVFDKILMVDDGKDATIGAPYIKEAKVEGKITKIAKHDKVMVTKYKAKSRYLKTNGHRQPYFEVEITTLK